MGRIPRCRESGSVKNLFPKVSERREEPSRILVWYSSQARCLFVTHLTKSMQLEGRPLNGYSNRGQTDKNRVRVRVNFKRILTENSGAYSTCGGVW